MRILLLFFLLSFHILAIAERAVLIENVTIVSAHTEMPQLHMNVLIKDGLIEKISNQTIKAHQNVVDGTGKFLVPGIMDSHAHVSLIPGMGFGVEPMARKHPKLAEQYYQQQPSSFLYYGVTQLLDPNPGLNWQKFVTAEIHPDYFRCEVITSKETFPYVEKTDDESRSMYRYLVDEKAAPNAPFSAEALVGQIAQSGAHCLKLYFEDGYGNDSRWPILSAKTLGRIRESASNADLLIVAHANAFDMQELAIAANVDVLAHGMWNWGKYSRAQEFPDAMKKQLDDIVAKRIGYVPTQRVIAGLGELMIPQIAESQEFARITPAPLLQWYKTLEAQWFKREMRNGFEGMPDNRIVAVFLYGRVGNGNRIINYLNKADHPILLGSDFPGSPSYANQPGLTTYQEMKAMVAAGLSPKQVLAAATINSAMAFNIQSRYGTVERGKVANLLLLKGNPLESVEAWDSIEYVILHGDVIKRELLAAKE